MTFTKTNFPLHTNLTGKSAHLPPFPLCDELGKRGRPISCQHDRFAGTCLVDDVIQALVQDFVEALPSTSWAVSKWCSFTRVDTEQQCHSGAGAGLCVHLLPREYWAVSKWCSFTRVDTEQQCHSGAGAGLCVHLPPREYWAVSKWCSFTRVDTEQQCHSGAGAGLCANAPKGILGQY